MIFMYKFILWYNKVIKDKIFFSNIYLLKKCLVYFVKEMVLYLKLDFLVVYKE